MLKSKRIDLLEEQQRKSVLLVNQVCQQNFQFLRQKTSDFYKSIEGIKGGYERQLMESEEKLSLEQKRCDTLIKTRVAPLEDKLSKSKLKEDALNKKLKETQLQKESNEKEIRMLRERANDSQGELAKQQQVWSAKLKQTEDEMKQAIAAEKRRYDELIGHLKATESQAERLQRSVDAV